ncbi:MAG: peptidoglycan DD-metalloendopeptidase family protein [Gammaproteobacteria bacterium]|jgi:septal ring factor EnvC (AmiA/AmiB activator)
MADAQHAGLPGLPGKRLSAVPVLLLLVCLCSLPWFTAPSPVQAAGADEQEAKLQQLRQHIQAVKQELAGMLGERDAQQQALEKSEKEIGSVAAALRRLEQQAREADDKILDLKQQRDREQGNLQAMRSALALELRTAYIAGRQERIKLLLNQQDPAFLGRMLVYHGYFSQARAARIEAMRKALARLDDIEQALLAQQLEIDRLQTVQREKSTRLAAEQEKRRAIIAGLQAGLKEKTSELSLLEKDEQRLQQLVQSLQQALSDIPAASGQYKSLRELKGKLHWPVAGKIVRHYGSSQAAGKISSRGVQIASAAGADVHAIARGRVVFADWLRGFGLLLIIDHGSGYMSLYGHNSSLYKEVGETVDGAEVVAAVGSSGGLSVTGLYLELRKNGRPFDPAPWFKGKPAPLQASR